MVAHRFQRDWRNALLLLVYPCANGRQQRRTEPSIFADIDIV